MRGPFLVQRGADAAVPVDNGDSGRGLRLDAGAGALLTAAVSGCETAAALAGTRASAAATAVEGAGVSGAFNDSSSNAGFVPSSAVCLEGARTGIGCHRSSATAGSPCSNLGNTWSTTLNTRTDRATSRAVTQRRAIQVISSRFEELVSYSEESRQAQAGPHIR